MPEFRREDLALKLVALLIAFALWAQITGEDRAVKDLSLPLQVDLPPTMILAEPPPTTVTVRVVGPRTLIRKLEPVGLAVRLDLREAAPGARDLQLSEAWLSGLPRRVSVELFDPERVRLVVDRRLRRQLPVEPDVLGSPAEGYTLYGSRVRPERVMVEGPESAVAGLTALRTEPIRLDGRMRSFTVSVGPVPDRPQVRILDPNPLEVRLIVDEAPIEIAFEDVPVLASDPAAGPAIVPPRLRVVVSGPRALLERLTPGHVRAVADLSGLELTDRPQSVRVITDIVDLPEEQLWRLGVKAILPRTVSVRRGPRSLPG